LESQDPFYVGTLKGIGQIYQQTFIDIYAKVGFAKLYTTKTPITSADLLNDRVLPFFEAYQLPLPRILTDRANISAGLRRTTISFTWPSIGLDHTKTKAKSPQNNGICERFHKTILQEFYQVAFRKKIYQDIETLQTDLDEWMHE
jgi:transposase InsO family protein